MGKQLVNFITCGCESSAPFLYFIKPGANPRRIGFNLVLVIGLYELLGNQISLLMEPHGIFDNISTFEKVK
jgi:hypothetical protein